MMDSLLYLEDGGLYPTAVRKKIILLSSENDKPEVGTTADQCRHAISYLKYYMKHLMEVQYEQDLQFPAIGKTRRKVK